MAEVKTAEQIEAELKNMQDSFEAKAKEAADAAAINLKKDFEAQIEIVKALYEKVKSVPEGIDLNDMNEKLSKTIDGFDKLQVRLKDFKVNGEQKVKSLGDAIKEKMEEFGVIWGDKGDKGNGGKIEQALKSQGGSISVPLGPVNLKTDMILSNTLTGDPVATYNQRQGIIPAQKVNFRGLIPTVYSPTGLYVTYRENAGGSNNIAKQAEGASKGNNSYAFTEVKTVESYVAGYSRFSKQLIKFLPFMQNTLTKALMRDFYKSENAQFNTTLTGAASGASTSGGFVDDIEALISCIGAQLDTDYGVSFVYVPNAIMARLIQATYKNGYYAGAGSVAITNQGGVISIWGVPIIAASWATANQAVLVDNDYIERVEAEGLNLTFSFDDADNFTKNLVTARIECMEELNLLRTEAFSVLPLGLS
jgi:hypothetical protein